MTDQNPAQKRLNDQRIVADKTLSLIVFDGISDAVIVKAAVAANYAAEDARRLFPGGMNDVFNVYTHHLNAQLADKVEADDTLEHLRMHERIAYLIKQRFSLAEPHKEALRLLAARMVYPWNQPTLTSNLWAICDQIWHLAGDTSTDFNYYTKRSLLMKVYVSTSLVWMNDESEHHQESWEFMERRISDVLKFGKFFGQTTSKITGTVENITDSWLNRGRYRVKRR